MKTMSNKHDQRRRKQIVGMLRKAKEKLETAKVYLIANDRPDEEYFETTDAIAYVSEAIERLTGELEVET